MRSSSVSSGARTPASRSAGFNGGIAQRNLFSRADFLVFEILPGGRSGFEAPTKADRPLALHAPIGLRAVVVVDALLVGSIAPFGLRVLIVGRGALKLLLIEIDDVPAPTSVVFEDRPR